MQTLSYAALGPGKHSGAYGAGRPRPPPCARARRAGPPPRGHHSVACTRGGPASESKGMRCSRPLPATRKWPSLKRGCTEQRGARRCATEAALTRGLAAEKWPAALKVCASGVLKLRQRVDPSKHRETPAQATHRASPGTHRGLEGPRSRQHDLLLHILRSAAHARCQPYHGQCGAERLRALRVAANKQNHQMQVPWCRRHGLLHCQLHVALGPLSGVTTTSRALGVAGTGLINMRSANDRYTGHGLTTTIGTATCMGGAYGPKHD